MKATLYMDKLHAEIAVRGELLREWVGEDDKVSIHKTIWGKGEVLKKVVYKGCRDCGEALGESGFCTNLDCLRGRTRNVLGEQP